MFYKKIFAFLFFGCLTLSFLAYASKEPDSTATFAAANGTVVKDFSGELRTNLPRLQVKMFNDTDNCLHPPVGINEQVKWEGLEDQQLEPLPDNKGNIYYYGDNPPDVCFFGDKAKWDGSKVTASDWGLFTDFQKTMFISEYIAELEKNTKTTIDINGWDYLVALNGFADHCAGECLKQPIIRVIKDLLIENKKIKE